MKSPREPQTIPGEAAISNSDELTPDELDMVIGGLAHGWWNDGVWQITDPEAAPPK